MLYKIYRKEILFPVISFVLIIVLTLLIWEGMIKSHKDAISKNLALSGKITTQKLDLILKHDIESLENLKIRIEFANGHNFDYWQNDAQLILEQNASFHFIEWIDTTMMVKSVVPLLGNEQIINLDISNLPYRKAEWIEHSQENSTNIMPWTKMTQGGYAFLIDVPVYFQNKFQGTISAGMDFNESLNILAKELKEYGMEIRDNEGTLFYAFNTENIDNRTEKLFYEEKLIIDKLHNKYWSFKIFPSNSLLSAGKLNSINLGLPIGLFLALIIAFLVHFYIKAKDRTIRAIGFSKALSKSNHSLKKEKNKAEKALKVKSEFLSNMSHEIRTPLHAVLGFIEIIKDSKLNEADKMYVDLLNKSSANLLSIVNDILVIDKLETGNIKLEKNDFSPSQKVEELIDTYKHLFYEKGLYVRSKVKEPLGAHVIGDQSKLSQIIINVLKNASKFTTKGGVIISYCEEKMGNQLNVKITVEDSGIGIPKHKIKYVFGRFTQIDGNLNKQQEGSGLGLAICKELVDIMGGSIQFHSILGLGTKFAISLSFPLAINQVMPIKNKVYNNLNLYYLNILIVDDNKMNIIILKRILEDSNINVDIAMNGKIAVNLIENNTYDIVFMDIHMPEMDGFQATRLIRTFDRDIKIFGLSANVTLEAKVEALNCGMDDYMTKPFNKEQLYKLLLPTLECKELLLKDEIVNNKRRSHTDKNHFAT